jgi:FPC/CPF motif-containing protein YcgG
VENINFGPEEFKLLETKYPSAFWEMVASVKIREIKELRKELETKPEIK